MSGLLRVCSTPSRLDHPLSLVFHHVPFYVWRYSALAGVILSILWYIHIPSEDSDMGGSEVAVHATSALDSFSQIELHGSVSVVAISASWADVAVADADVLRRILLRLSLRRLNRRKVEGILLSLPEALVQRQKRLVFMVHGLSPLWTVLFYSNS